MQKFVWLLVAWVLILGFLVGDGSVHVFGHILPHNNLPLSSLPWQQVYVASLSSQRRPTYWKPLQLESMLRRHARRHRHHHSRHGESSPSLHPSPSSGSSKHRPIEILPAQAPNSRVARPPEPLRQRNPSPTFAPLSSPSSQPNIPVVPPSRGETAGGFPPPSSSPASDEGCQQLVCSPPLTSTTFGSPCGCVLPMQIEINLGVASYEVLPLVTELEIEVAAATYLRQSQVRIMSADADIQDEGKTTVNIDLVPLGEKFDYVSALLIYQRFVQNKVAINRSLFGGYEVAYIRYPGLPSPLPSAVGNSSNLIGPGPTNQDPFGANVVKTTQKSAWRVAIITLCVVVSASSFLGVLALIFMVFKKRQNPPAAAQSLPPSLNKRSAPRSILSSSMASSTSVSLESSMLTYTLTVKTFTISELRKATNNFSMKNVVGEGGFGRVYLATLTDSTKVAVKVLNKEAQHGDREFIAEVEMLSRLHHRNLVKLIGICIEEHNRCLVYELVPNGSVESHLHGKHRQTAPLDWDARMKIALGTARGLAYLHEDSNPRVIHRDFKAANVLLENDFTPKVSDFGLAREASDGSQHISTRVMGTFGYVAPEYAMTGHLLVKSDVYSYGVMLIELLSGRKPVDMSKPPGQENLVTWARPLLTNQEGLEQLVDHNLVGNCNFDNIARVAAIASMCVHPEVSQRPFMGEVVQALKLVYNEVDDTGEDCQSQRENSSCRGSSSKAEFTTENSWGHERVPCFTTMEYSSGRLDTTRRPVSALNLAGGNERESYLEEHHNKSWPMQMVHQEPLAFRLRGSMSEHGPPSRHVSDEEFWV